MESGRVRPAPARPSCGHTAAPRPGGAYQAHRPRHPDVRSVFVGSVTPPTRVRNCVLTVLRGLGCPSCPRPLLPALCLGPPISPTEEGARGRPVRAARNRSGKWRAEEQSRPGQHLAARFTGGPESLRENEVPTLRWFCLHRRMS